MSDHRTTLESRWETGESFLASVLPQEEGPAQFFHPARPDELPEEIKPGALVSVVIRFLDRDTAFHVHARVLERISAGDSPGLRLEFLPSEQNRELLVLTSAKGESVPYFRRRHERVDCDLPVTVSRGLLRKRQMRVLDVSEGGARLAGDTLPELDTVVTLAIEFPHTRVTIKGRVRTSIGEGPQRGVGVEFLFESREQREALVAGIGEL